MSTNERELAEETLALTDTAIAACRYLDAVRVAADCETPFQERTTLRELRDVREELLAHIGGTTSINDLANLASIVGELARMKIRSAKIARAAVIVCGHRSQVEGSEDADPAAFMVASALLPFAWFFLTNIGRVL